MDDLFSRDPWPHQRDGVQQTIDALSNGTSSVCLTAPTGSGKTAMQIALARWGAERMKKRVLCLTNRILLTQQTRRVFEDDGVSVGVISASMPHLERPDAQVQIATIQTLLARRRSDWAYLENADILLVDEVHQCAEGASADLLNEYKEKGAKVCGITATPLGVCNVCDELIVAARTRDLQRQGILCFAHWFAPSELDTRNLVKNRVDLSLTEGQQRKTWGAPESTARAKIVGNILEHYRRLHPELTHTLAFAPGVQESLWAAQYCKTMGIPALHVDGTDFWVDGELCDRKRDESLFQASMQRWRDGDIPILWNRFVLREGIDEPQIKCLMLATPVGSYRSYLQMVGRGLRTHESKQVCQVLDFGGNWWRHGSVNVNVDWEDVYNFEDPEIISKNRVSKQREEGEPMGQVCPKCGMVHRAFSRMMACQYCGHEMTLYKPSRPILQADGKLTRVSGEPIKQWNIQRTPEAAEIWERIYWSAMKKGGNVTGNELYARFGYKTAVLAGTPQRPDFRAMYYPPRDLPLMPKNRYDWHRQINLINSNSLYKEGDCERTS